MKKNIPFDDFYDYYKNHSALTNNEEEFKQKINKQTQWLNAMNGVTWQDLEDLTAEEMIKIPICWIYDWTHVTANYDLQDRVEWLYKRYNLPIYTIWQYLKTKN